MLSTSDASGTYQRAYREIETLSDNVDKFDDYYDHVHLTFPSNDDCSCILGNEEHQPDHGPSVPFVTLQHEQGMEQINSS